MEKRNKKESEKYGEPVWRVCLGIFCRSTRNWLAFLDSIIRLYPFLRGLAKHENILLPTILLFHCEGKPFKLGRKKTEGTNCEMHSKICGEEKEKQREREKLCGRLVIPELARY